MIFATDKGRMCNNILQYQSIFKLLKKKQNEETI